MKRKFDRHDSDFGLNDLLSFLRRAAIPAVVFAVAVAFFTYWKLSKNPSFSASGFIMLESSQSNKVQAMVDKITGFSNNNYYGTNHFAELMLMTLSSREFSASIAKSLMESKEFDFVAKAINVGDPKNVHSVTASINGSISYSRHAPSVIRITVSQKQPSDAEKLVNIFLNEVIKAYVGQESLEISEAHNFLEGQITLVEERMKTINAKIDGESKGSGGLAKNDSTFPQRAAEIDRDILEYRLKLAEVNSSIREVKESASSNVYGVIDKYDTVTSLNRLEREKRVLELKLASSQKVLQAMKLEESRQPDSKRYFENLFRRLDIEYQLVSDLKKELMSLSVQRISAQNKVRVFESAYPGSARANLNMPTAILKRSIFAAIVALVLVFLGDVVRPIVHDNRSLSHAGISYLGSVPNLHHIGNGLLSGIMRRYDNVIPIGAKSGTGAFKILDFSPDSQQDIVIKNLRMRMTRYRGLNGKTPKVICFVSAVSGEGKTFLSTSIGKSIASGGKRVLIIDADLRSKSASKSLGLGNEKGLGEYLESPLMDRPKPLVHRLSSRLEVLPAGNCMINATEAVSNQTFEEMVFAMREFYDYIVIDTPPALPYSEVVTVAHASDLVVLSTFVGRTPVRSVDHVIDKLRFACGTPIGYVLNMNNHEQVNSYYPYPSAKYGKQRVGVAS